MSVRGRSPYMLPRLLQRNIWQTGQLRSASRRRFCIFWHLRFQTADGNTTVQTFLPKHILYF
jgi:hypothetical protein